MPNARRSLKRTARGRVVKRRANRMRVPRAMAVRPNTLTIKRKTYLTSWTWGTTTTNDFWRYQTLLANNIPNFAEFSSVFDTYRINGLKFTYMPRYSSTNAEAAGTTGSPQAYAHYIIDPDSTLIPSGVYGSSTLNSLMENTNCKTRQLNRPFSIYYKPRVLQQLLGGSTASFTRPAPFIRATDVNVDFRGHHMYIQQNNFSSSANANIILDIFVTFYVTFKNVR